MSETPQEHSTMIKKFIEIATYMERYFPEMLDTFMESMELVVARNQKYTPNRSISRFWNFEIQAQLLDVPPLQAFNNLIAVKVSRLFAGTGDHDDESAADTYLDLMSYSALAHAYLTINS